MPPKRKRREVPESRHHASQSSADVPVKIKDDIKRLQDKKCWLCDQKAHSKRRPLQIYHIFPQAEQKRYNFKSHHKFSRIQLHNIHDRGNLVALCLLCHTAFDSDEWTFIPEDTTNWTQRIEATPQTIQEYNSQRNIVFRRLLLVPNPDSKAFQDKHYKSAFTDSPTKIWPGEPGVLIMRPPYAPPPKPAAELKKTLRDFRVLCDLWFEYESPCIKEKCPICQTDNNEDDDGNKEDGGEDGGEDSEEDGREDGEGDGRGDGGEDGGEDGEEDSEEDSEEDEEGDKDFSSSRKRGKGISKRQPDSTGQQPPLQDFDTKKSIQANKHRKKPKHAERDWMTSAPYDKSIPYSHRYGYTWAGTTSNELMKLWQVYRKPVEN